MNYYRYLDQVAHAATDTVRSKYEALNLPENEKARTFFGSFVERHIATNEHSLVAFANALGMSRNYMYQLIQGERIGVSDDAMYLFAERMGLSMAEIRLVIACDKVAADE